MKRRDRDIDIAKDAVTGNGFDRDQAATTNFLLRKNIVETRDLLEISKNLVYSQKKTKESIDSLISVVATLDLKNEKLQLRFYYLTIATGILALAQLVLAIYQVSVSK